MNPIRLSGLHRLEPGVPLPLQPAADLLLVTSSAEIGILSTPRCRVLLRALTQANPQAELRFLSIGCAGVAACLLEFAHSGARSALVLVIESPAGWVQSTLDAAGIGAGGDGFQAQDIGFLFTLSREAADRGEQADDAAPPTLLHCSLLAREPGLAGTARLASRLVALMAEVQREHADTRIVSFENSSQWSQRLARLVDVLARQAGLAGRPGWLDSVESDQRHYMTARPLLDWHAHADIARRHPLLLACLGAGGRVGVMLLGQGRPSGVLALPTPQPLDLEAPGAAWFAATQPPPSSVLYADRSHFGRSQFYFRWRLSHEHFRHP